MESFKKSRNTVFLRRVIQEGGTGRRQEPQRRRNLGSVIFE